LFAFQIVPDAVVRASVPLTDPGRGKMKASGSQPSTRIALLRTRRSPPTARSEPPNAATSAAPCSTVASFVTFTEPESTAQVPVTVSEAYVPPGIEPPLQV
jgi:hypothetical protein